MNALWRNTLVGIGSALTIGGVGWFATAVVANSSEIATMKAVHDIQYKNIDESLREMKDSQQRLENKFDRIIRRVP